MARQTKTERQRAEEALAVAERQAKRLNKQVTRLRAELDAAQVALNEAADLVVYRRQHPALQNTTPTTTEENQTA